MGKQRLQWLCVMTSAFKMHFHDGILWITLGERPDDLTARVRDLIETVSGGRPAFSTLEAATAHLSSAPPGKLSC
ncbi:MAG: hypothetical protein QM706_20625 [Nitrospira sp.]